MDWLMAWLIDWLIVAKLKSISISGGSQIWGGFQQTFFGKKSFKSEKKWEKVRKSAEKHWFCNPVICRCAIYLRIFHSIVASTWCMDMFVDSGMVMSSVSLICEWLLFSGLSLNWQLSILKENDVGSLAIFGFYSIILEKPNFKFSKWVQPKPAKSSQVKTRKGNESKQTVSISQVPNFSKLADVSIFDRKEMVELINMKRILHLGAALSCMVFFPQTDFQGGNCSHCSQSKL